MKRSLSKPKAKTKSKSPRKRKTTKTPTTDPTKKKKRKTTTTTTTKKKKKNDVPFYTVISPVELLDKHIVNYQKSTVVKTASFTNGTYFYVTPWGKPTYCGGLHSLLKKYFYPDYNPKHKTIAHKTNMKSSTSSHGKIVDKQLLLLLGGKVPVNRKLAETKAILDHFESIGHIGQAAQLPVEIPKANRLTQADYITKCKVTGDLWLWEVKTGGKNLEHEVATVYFNHIKGEVPCTQTNIWQIQLHFTRKSLEVAGVPIKQARVIQVGKHQFSDHVRVLVHPQPEWIKNIELNHIFEK